MYKIKLFDKEYEIGGIQIMNSVFFAEHLEEVAFINLKNYYAIIKQMEVYYGSRKI